MPKKLRVLFVEPCPVYFGGYFRALNICQGLCHAGHQVDLLVASNKKFFFKIEKQNPTPGLNLYVLPRFYFNLFIQGRSLRAFIAILFGLFHHYDIYHLAMPSSPESNIPALFFKLIGKKHLVIDWDDIYEEGFFKSSPVYSRYIKFFEGNFPRIFKNYCTTSQYLADIAKDRGATHVIKIINGVNPNQFTIPDKAISQKELKLDTKLRYILSIGNTFDGPRGTLLLETFNELVKLDPSFRMLVNFDPSKVKVSLPPAAYQKIISVGFIPPAELGKYMVVSLGALFLSNSSPMEKAGFPIRIGSFLNGQLPIFAVKNDTEVSRIISEYHCGVQAENPKKLAAAIVATVKDKAGYEKLVAQTIEAKKLLTINELSLKLAKFYRNLET